MHMCVCHDPNTILPPSVHATYNVHVYVSTLDSVHVLYSTFTLLIIYTYTCCYSPVCLGDSGEDSFFDIGGEVIDEMAPQPHLLVVEGNTSLSTSQGGSSSASNANHSNKGTGTFPQLDSHLLQVLYIHDCMLSLYQLAHLLCTAIPTLYYIQYTLYNIHVHAFVSSLINFILTK